MGTSGIAAMRWGVAKSLLREGWTLSIASIGVATSHS